jgi:AraC-like DNA-binding protein
MIHSIMTYPQTSRKLARARDFMREVYRQPVTLADISAQANLSPHHFLRTFQNTFQESPLEYLTRLRVERAKTLLQAGQHSVLEVCSEIGFESPSTFSAFFARHVGLLPSEYRRLARSSIVIPSPYLTLFVPSCFLSMYGGINREPQD